MNHLIVFLKERYVARATLHRATFVKCLDMLEKLMIILGFDVGSKETFLPLYFIHSPVTLLNSLDSIQKCLHYRNVHIH